MNADFGQQLAMSRKFEEKQEPLLIDRAAAAELPSAAAVREWAREKRAFISSVMSELAEERHAIAASLRAEGVRAVMFEEFGGHDADPLDAYVAEVEGSDIFIGILGRTYGFARLNSSEFSDNGLLMNLGNITPLERI